MAAAVLPGGLDGGHPRPPNPPSATPSLRVTLTVEHVPLDTFDGGVPEIDRQRDAFPIRPLRHVRAAHVLPLENNPGGGGGAQPRRGYVKTKR